MTCIRVRPKALSKGGGPRPEFTLHGEAAGDLRPEADLAAEDGLDAAFLVVVEASVNLPGTVFVDSLPA
jgi:hypothetical protein